MLTPPPLHWYSLSYFGAVAGRNLPIYPPNASLFYWNAWDHDLMPNYIQGRNTKRRDDAHKNGRAHSAHIVVISSCVLRAQSPRLEGEDLKRKRVSFKGDLFPPDPKCVNQRATSCLTLTLMREWRCRPGTIQWSISASGHGLELDI